MKIVAKVYRSSRQALAWCFRKSRDTWKAKCGVLRGELNRQRVHVRDARKARDAWRVKHEAELQRVTELELRVAELEADAERERGRTCLAGKKI